jgi:hypothetical protein
MTPVRGIAIFVVVVLAAGCASSGSNNSKPKASAKSAVPTTTRAPKNETAGDFIKRVFGYYDQGQYAQVWNSIHPAQRSHVPESLFVQCQRDSFADQSFTNVTILYTRPVSISIPGTALKNQRSTAVEFEVTGTSNVVSNTLLQTFHLFNIAGQWHFIVKNIAPYTKGQCPAR